MSVPAAGVSVVHGDIDPAGVATNDAVALRGQEIGSQRLGDERRQRLAGEQQRAPRQVGAGESRGRVIPLDVGGGGRPPRESAQLAPVDLSAAVLLQEGVRLREVSTTHKRNRRTAGG